MWIISALLDDKKQRNRQNMAEIDKCLGVSVVNNLITRQHIVDLCKLPCSVEFTNIHYIGLELLVA